MAEWGSIEWIKGFVRQAKISEEIKKYNEEIDRYCQRFMVRLNLHIHHDVTQTYSNLGAGEVVHTQL